VECEEVSGLCVGSELQFELFDEFGDSMVPW
jgi:hypothetical protein